MVGLVGATTATVTPKGFTLLSLTAESPQGQAPACATLWNPIPEGCVALWPVSSSYVGDPKFLSGFWVADPSRVCTHLQPIPARAGCHNRRQPEHSWHCHGDNRWLLLGGLVCRCCTSTCPPKVLTPTPETAGTPCPPPAPFPPLFTPLHPTGNFQTLLHHLTAASNSTSCASVFPALLMLPQGRRESLPRDDFSLAQLRPRLQSWRDAERGSVAVATRGGRLQATAQGCCRDALEAEPEGPGRWGMYP